MPNNNIVTIYFLEVRTELYFTESSEAFYIGITSICIIGWYCFYERSRRNICLSLQLKSVWHIIFNATQCNGINPKKTMILLLLLNIVKSRLYRMEIQFTLVLRVISILNFFETQQNNLVKKKNCGNFIANHKRV